MRLSHVISSRNRADRLRACLARFDADEFRRNNVELILVDSASTDQTLDVMKTFAEQSAISTRVMQAERPGLSIGRNLGISVATGDLLVFTDDDCYLDPNYHAALLGQLDPSLHQYGGGSVLLFDPTDDAISARGMVQTSTIAPNSVLLAGTISGCNMFFLRRVFDKIGLFDEDLGSGTPFPCEDVELQTRASLAGFAGLLLPNLIVYHHHGRKPGSIDVEETQRGYDAGRGAYYAKLLANGMNGVWSMWQQLSWTRGPMPSALMTQLEREFRGAADYLKQRLSKQPSIRN